MNKKFVVVSIALVYFLMMFITFASAEDTTETITDPEDDVIYIDDETGDILTTDKEPNIDIVSLSYSRDNQNKKSITVTLEVNSDGEIEDSSYDLEDLDNLLNLVIVYYFINIETSESDYTIDYIDKVCTLNYEEIPYSVSGNKLSVSFELDSEGEEILSILGASYKATYDGEYEDYIPDEFQIVEVNADGPSEGDVGEELSFTGSVDGDPSDYEWLWDFGDGDISTEQNPTHIYEEAGEYDVFLEASNDVLGYYGADNFTVIVTGDGNNNGNGNGNGNDNGDADNGDSSDSDSSYLLFFGLIIIIIAIGTSVLVIILRR